MYCWLECEQYIQTFALKSLPVGELLGIDQVQKWKNTIFFLQPKLNLPIFALTTKFHKRWVISYFILIRKEA